MQLRVIRQAGRDSVSAAVSEDESAEGVEAARAMSPGEPVDELAVRRRFDALVAPHMPALRACANRLCRSHHDADDVVQNSLLRAFRTRSQVSDPARIRAWLLTIVTHTFIDLTRKQRRRPLHVQLVDDVPVPVPDPAEPAPWDHIEPDDLRGAIDRLSDDVRDTYRMFALEGRDYISISKAQQIPKATVGSRIFRARKQLRALLTAELATEKVRGKPRP